MAFLKSANKLDFPFTHLSAVAVPASSRVPAPRLKKPAQIQKKLSVGCAHIMAHSTVTRQKRWDCSVDSNPTFAIELRNGIAQKLKGMWGSVRLKEENLI